MKAKTSVSAVVNGVDVAKLVDTIEAVKASPVIARFRFRAHNEWIDCGHNRTTLKDFYGTGENITREKPFVLEADEPPVLLGTDKGPNPVEYLLKALAACVTTSIVYHAAARDIAIDEIEAKVEGDIDLQGFLGIRDDVRRGYQGIRMTYRIKADASDEEIQEIVNLGPTFSPVFDSITKGVPVKVTTMRA